MVLVDRPSLIHISIGFVYFHEYGNSIQSDISSWTGTLVFNDDTKFNKLKIMLPE